MNRSDPNPIMQHYVLDPCSQYSYICRTDQLINQIQSHEKIYYSDPDDSLVIMAGVCAKIHQPGIPFFKTGKVCIN
jgi:hypothetical protein